MLMNLKFDAITLLLVVMLLVTLGGFVSGAFPYPFGWLVIAGLLVWRVMGLEKK